MKKRTLLTAALPYANGPLHLGHMVEYVLADIWARFRRLSGHECIFVGAEDAHGTPIMLQAQREGTEPEQLIERMGALHRQDFADFSISFDNYHSTHSPENKELVEQVYQKLLEGGHIKRRRITQAFDERAGLFLPDRYVRGSCPRCGADDQYGDSCENCGATYSPLDLIEPRSSLSGERPTARESEHLFFRLADFADFLDDWLAQANLQPEIAHKLKEWTQTGLKDWDISRDAPYWGFAIPGEEDKYFYVWLDAPIGYMASFLNLCRREGVDFDDFWKQDSSCEVYHFIGKDIAYFHTLFWPAMLKAAGRRPPTSVFCHGFLTINGTKMSKSRGTFITAAHWKSLLPTDYLRYYFAAKLNDGIEDIDLSADDFKARIDSDLVGKFANLASRSASILARSSGNRLAERLDRPDDYKPFVEAGARLAGLFERRRLGRALREIAELADRANQSFNDRAPWKLKEEKQIPEVQRICTQAINSFRALACYLKPVIPTTIERAEAFLGETLNWDSPREPLVGTALAPYEPLAERVDSEALAALFAEPEVAATWQGSPGRSVIQ